MLSQVPEYIKDSWQVLVESINQVKQAKPLQAGRLSLLFCILMLWLSEDEALLSVSNKSAERLISFPNISGTKTDRDVVFDVFSLEHG